MTEIVFKAAMWTIPAENTGPDNCNPVINASEFGGLLDDPRLYFSRIKSLIGKSPIPRCEAFGELTSWHQSPTCVSSFLESLAAIDGK
jgi:hypothetical protein